MWTFGRRVALGFGVSVAMLGVVGGVAYRGLGVVAQTTNARQRSYNSLDRIGNLLNLSTDAETGTRGYIITGVESFLEPHRAALARIPGALEDLRTLTADNPNHRRRLVQIEKLIAQKSAELQRTIDMRRTQGADAASKIVLAGEGKTIMDDLRSVFAEMELEERGLLDQRQREAELSISASRTTIIVGTLACLLVVTGAGLAISRSLNAQIGAAVQRMESSSTELQATATQQSTGTREYATSMSEITTTISELLATSRQIAESAQHVTQMAGQTADAVRSGNSTVDRGDEAIAGTRRQVDLVVSHMLDLGKKSQQIGTVLEIVSELAEQTNILAINATIEATGAGDAGKRFGVVADEIRKLADRVAAATKEVRNLIEEVRSAVNTTVMATETGSKAVDAGARQFGDVAAAFKQIGGLVASTSEAAREISLSTKQQTTAVEQVNVAIASVTQAAKETEASAGQTLQTASQLAGLSRELTRIVRPRATA